jgi:hypothetical protein
VKKVIRHGTTTFETTCNACGCEFQYERGDVVGDGVVTCPDCGACCAHSRMTPSCPRPYDNPWIPQRRWALGVS